MININNIILAKYIKLLFKASQGNDHKNLHSDLKMGILEKIAEIEREINRTQKNKATEYHLGTLKAKLAKYRAQLLEPVGV